jgi:hypothetical protein
VNHDQNKKTLRQFQCRDYLWEIFEQMSGELECSVDYLINEAMRQYARSRNYGVRTPGPGTRPPQPQASTPGPQPKPSIPSAPPPPPARPSGSYPGGYGAPPPPSAGAYPPPPAPPRPAAPPVAPPPGPAYPPPPAAGPAYPPPPRPPSSYPPPSPTQRPPAFPGAPQAPALPPYSAPPAYPTPNAAPPPLPSSPGAQMSSAQLFVIFNGQKFPVQKEEFIIGRGTKTADLPIKDGNISRRHAAVIWQNGGWYIKDLGSTNGVEFQGRKVDSKRIEEGDIYQLCDYEIRFTYR